MYGLVPLILPQPPKCKEPCDDESTGLTTRGHVRRITGGTAADIDVHMGQFSKIKISDSPSARLYFSLGHTHNINITSLDFVGAWVTRARVASSSAAVLEVISTPFRRLQINKESRVLNYERG